MRESLQVRLRFCSQRLKLGPQVAIDLLAFHVGKAIGQFPKERFQLRIFASPAADLLNKAGNFLPAGPPQLIPVGGFLLVHTDQVLTENLLCQRRADDVHALFREKPLAGFCGIGDEMDVRVVPLVVKSGVPFQMGGRDLQPLRQGDGLGASKSRQRAAVSKPSRWASSRRRETMSVHTGPR